MIDLNWLRDHQAVAAEGFAAKGINAPIDRILALDTELHALQSTVEALNAEKNTAAKAIARASPDERAARIAELQERGHGAQNDRERLRVVEEELHDLLWNLPNLPAPDVKRGKNENENEELRTVGNPRTEVGLKSYADIGATIGAFDTERAGKVSGSRFAYLTGPGALLEWALLRHATRFLVDEGFTPVIPPVLVGSKAMDAMGYTLHGGKEESYYLDRDDLYLVGTAEQSIGPMHMDEILSEGELPKRYVAFSSCFRRESGSYGKDTRGIFRVHQFDKVEMVSFTTPERSDSEHELLLGIEERLLQSLELPYRVLKMCSGDLGIPAARKYDLEAWFPSEGRYRELTSTSTCTDWQARRLNIRYRPSAGGSPRFVHMLNGTAWSMNRPICAILEHYQQPDGSVRVPAVLAEDVGMNVLTPAPQHRHSS